MLVALSCIAGFTATADAATLYVSPTGSDASPGTAPKPFATIARAANAARSGDTVLVASGHYREQVSLARKSSGVTFRGEGPTRPLVDGERVRKHGFLVGAGVSGLRIENFEIANQTSGGIQVAGNDNTIAGNEIHHAGVPGDLFAWGVRAVKGTGHQITGNTIHDIGPGGESRGVLLIDTREANVEDNTIYLVRKEGVKDAGGLDNRIAGNRVFLTWIAIALNESNGSLATGNHVYDNAIGIGLKHTSMPATLALFGTGPKWNRVWRNTITRSSAAGIVIGPNGPLSDFIEIRENVFSRAATAYIADFPNGRGKNIVVDGNQYDDGPGAPPWLYHTGWDVKTGGHATLPALRAGMGWEAGGRVGPPLGALGPAPAPVTWTSYEMKPVASTSAGTPQTKRQLPFASDGSRDTYWQTASNRDEQATFDFGQQRTIDHVVLDVWSHRDRRGVRTIRFETSNDGVNFAPAIETVNPDDFGSTYAYTLPQPVSARYLRAVFVDTFCAAYAPRRACGEKFMISDVRAGSLGRAG